MARVQTAASAELDRRLARMLAAAPAEIGVTSEVRTVARQQQLWDAAVKKYGSAAEARKWVAPPGKSQHQLGHAADLSFSTPAARQWAHANAARFGLTFPLSNEPWHVELAEARTPQGRTSAPSGAAPVTSTPGDSLPPNPTPKQINDYVAKHYGYLAAFLNDKELGPILRQAAVEDWSDADLQGAVTATSWWKKTSDTTRTWDALNKLDPAKARGQVQGRMAELGDLAEQQGIVLTGLQLHDMAVNSLRFGWNSSQTKDALLAQGKHDPRAKTARDVDQLAKDDPATYQKLITDTTGDVQRAAGKLGVVLDGTQAKDLAVRAAREGWTAEDMSQHLSELVTVGKTNTGAVAVTVDGLRVQAAQYMVPLSDSTLQLWTQQILAGDQTPEAFGSYLKEQAKAMRPWMAKQIDAGLTAQQIADPYRQYASQLLEKPVDQIDLMNDPKFSVALDNVDPKTGERGPMSFTQWQQYLRNSDSYKQTAQANAAGADFATSLVKEFGKVAV